MLHTVMRRVGPLVTLAALASVPSSAHAEDTSAAGLLASGKRLMAAGQVAEACPKLAESQRLAPEVGTELLFADCVLSLGRTATAWRHYRAAAEVLARAKDPREAATRKKIEALTPRVGRIVIIPPVGAKPSLGLDCDGVSIRPSEWRAELPMDPGTHRVTATTLVGSTWSIRVTVPPEGGVQTVTIPDEVIGQTTLEHLARPSGSAREEDAAVSEEEPVAGDPGKFQRVLGLVVGGVGVVGIGVGTFFGIRAKSKLDDSNNGHCRVGDRCDAAGVVLRDDYLSAARISTVSFLVGGVLVAGGAVLYLTAPSTPVAVAVTGGPGGPHMVLRGTF